MHRLNAASIRQWTKDRHGTPYPSSFDTNCPHCGTMANFSVQDPSKDEPRNTVSATALCSACRNSVYIWFVEASELYVRPAPSPGSPSRAPS